MRTPSLVVVVVFVLGAGGCVRRDGRNTDCRWPGETSNHAISARHLSADAELAEDLAIRYADVHFGMKSPKKSERYGAERDQCMARLFEEIGKEHGVPVAQISGSLGQNRASIDLAEVLPFALLYSFAAIVAARMIWRSYTLAKDGWAAGTAMTLFVSLVLAAGSTILGELWNWFAEGTRIGNNHMSYRAHRLFYVRHRLELFAAALMIFWLGAIHGARRVRREHFNGH